MRSLRGLRPLATTPPNPRSTREGGFFVLRDKKVDEIGSNLTSGTITWGEGFNPGVYFIKEESGISPAKRVVLTR